MHMRISILTLIACLIISPLQIAAQSLEEFVHTMDSLSMVPPQIQSEFDAKYLTENLDYGMTIGIEQTPGGRIWNCFVGGGDNEDAFFVLQWSDDGGYTWTDSKFVIDPHSDSLPYARRTIVGQLWTDPLGRLWFFYDQSMTYYYGSATNWYSICENPDSDNPVWSEPKYLGEGCTLNKPTVMSTGEWVLPVSIWSRKTMAWTTLKNTMDFEQFNSLRSDLDPIRGAHTYVSTDQGKTWEDRGFVVFPHPTFDEHQYIELENGVWWMTGRVGIGTNNSAIIQSFSKDKGYTWSEPEVYQPHISSRHFIRKLKNGHLVLVRHGHYDECTKTRTNLTAFISEDNGKTWKGGLLLDDTYDVSYPTGFQAKDGYIYISYDLQRAKRGEIYLAKFKEKDVLAGKIVTRKGFTNKLIFKPGKLK
jgi:hypothetical protein